MKKRILTFVMTVVFILSAFPSVGIAAVDNKDDTKKVYKFADAEDGRLDLNDYWQVANFPDTAENINNNPYKHMDLSDFATFDALANKGWKAVEVPGNLHLLSGFENAHRVWYHCQIDVPESAIGNNGFYLDFDGTNWIASVVVNNSSGASLAGWKKSTRLPWKADLTNQLEAGLNDIYIGIKAPRYAIDPHGSATMTAGGTTDYEQDIKNRKNLSDFFGPDFSWYLEGSTDQRNSNLRHLKWVAPIYPSSKGKAQGDHFGITDEISLVATGSKVYATDVFVKTNVADSETFKQTATSKTITADVTLINTTNSNKTVKLAAEAWLRDGDKEKDLGEISVTVPANSSKVFTFENIQWPEAKLWWPEVEKDRAPMYDLKVSVTDGGNVNETVQSFGFRDVKIDGKYFRINGLRRNFWNALDGLRGSTPEEMLETFKKENNRFERYGADLGLDSKLPGNPNSTEQLNWLDENGLPVRYSSMIDGMFANFYMANWRKPDEVNTVMFENFRDHIQDMVISYRNHPSIIVWSLENELMFINAALLFKSSLTYIEEAVEEYLNKPCFENDPTRPSMLDGGGAGMKNQFQIYCHHYLDDKNITTSDVPLTNLPPSQGVWKYDGKKPFVGGEVLYFSGANSEHSWVGGEEAANGKKEALIAYSEFIKKSYERFRWGEGAMIFPWTASASTTPAHNSLHPIAVIPKEYKTSLWDSKGFTNDYRIFNDTFSDKPITVKWSLTVKDQVVQSGEKVFNIEPGFSEEFTVKLDKVTGITEKTTGFFKFESSQEGTASFEETFELAIFPPVKKFKVNRQVYLYNVNKAVRNAIKKMGVKFKQVPKKEKVKKTKKVKVLKKNGKPKKKNGKVVYKTVVVKKKVKVLKKNGKPKKKNGKIVYKRKPVFIKQKVKFNAKTYKKYLKKKKGILIVGHNGLKGQMGSGDSGAVVRFANGGGRVIILEHPFSTMIQSEADNNRSLPIKLYADLNDYASNYNFGQGFDRPILKGLTNTDLQFWNGGGISTSVNWAKTPDAKCWVSGKSQLSSTSLIEVPSGKGVVTASQFKIGERIKIEPVAQYLLANLIKNANTFKLPKAVVGILSNENEELTKAIAGTNVATQKVSSISAALNYKKTPIVVVEASAKNLGDLNSNKSKVDDFVNKGGWIMLWNLKPEGLSNYNKLLGTQHLIRPFRKEATKSVSDWTTIGLGTNDYFLYNNEAVADWRSQYDVSPDTFTYCVDAVDNMTPFHDFEAEGMGNKYTAENRDGNKANIANDLYDDDFWHYIWQIWVGSGVPTWTERNNPNPTPHDIYTVKLPKAENLDSVIVYNNANYNAFKGFTVTSLDGTEETAKVSLDMPNSYDPTEFRMNKAKANTIKFTVNSFHDNNRTGEHTLVGLDEIFINRVTPQWIKDANVKSLTSNGSIVKYERGNGGFILNNVKLVGPFGGFEPRTQLKNKYRIFTVFFQNFNAKFNKAK